MAAILLLKFILLKMLLVTTNVTATLNLIDWLFVLASDSDQYAGRPFCPRQGDVGQGYQVHGDLTARETTTK